MNKIYRVIWNKATNTWTAVQETAKSHTKSSRTGVVSSASAGTGARFVYTALASASLIISGQVAYAVTGADTIGADDKTCFFDTTTQSVICGDATTSATNTGNTPKSVVMGLEATSNGESNVAVGRASQAAGTAAIALGNSAQAKANSSVAIGNTAQANAQWDISIGREAGLNTTPSTTGEGRNIAIGDGALRTAVNPQNNIAMGTGAGESMKSEASVVIGTYANGLIANKEILKATGGISANNVVAIGDRALATKSSAVAVGNRTQATGLSATAIGTNTNANADYAVAQGSNAQATANYSVAIGGSGNNTSSARATTNPFTTAVGYNSLATGRHATALGSTTSAVGFGSTAVGAGATTAVSSTAGATGAIAISAATDNGATQRTTASGATSVAVGVSTTASTENSIAIGNTATANGGAGAIAVGKGTTATGTSAVVMGTDSSGTAQSVVVIGNESNATKDNAVAIGIKANATGTGNIAIGANAGKAHLTTPQGNNTVLIGVEAGSQAANNQGQVSVGWQAGQGTLGAYNVASGYQAGQYVNGNNNVAFGKGAGSGTSASARLTANDTVSIGTNAQATKNNAIAIGNGAQANAINTISIGTGNVVSGEGSGAIGEPSTVSGTGSYSLGNDNTITTNDTFVIGNDVTQTLANSVILGDSSSASGINTGNYTLNGTQDANVAGKPVLANGVVSVGSAGAERQIQNVAAGVVSATSTDAINGSQLYAVAKELKDGQTHFYSVKNSDSTAANYNNDGATAADALAAGVGASATAYRAVAIGKDAAASKIEAVAIGTKAAASNTATVAISENAKASGISSIAIGLNTEASGNNSFVMGSGSTLTTTNRIAKASGNQSVAIGYQTQALGLGGTAIGSNATAAEVNYATAIGSNATAVAATSLAVGSSATANGASSVAIGRASTTYTGNDIAIGSDAKAGVDGAKDSSHSIAIGRGTQATQVQAVAIGNGAQVTVDHGVALGSNSVANVAAGQTGTDPLSAKDATASAGVWKATHAAVSVGNGTTVTRQITSVAAGTNDTDAVNVAQLKAAGFTLAASHAGGGESTSVTNDKIQNGETVTVDAGKNIKVTHTANQVSIATKDEVEFTQIKLGNSTNNTVLTSTANGLDVGGDKITNVANGDVSSTSKDAINGSQLYTTNQNVANNATAIANNAAEIAKGLNFGANDQTATAGDAIKRQLGETIGIKGGITDTTTATSGENVITRTDANGNINIELAKNAKFDSVTTGGTKLSDAGLSFVDASGSPVANSPSISKTGINAGNQVIAGVKAGTQDTDAVNVAQLNDKTATTPLTVGNTGAVDTPADTSKLATAGDIANAINKAGFTLTTAKTSDGELGATATNELINAGDTVTVEADKNIKVTQTNGKISIATKDDVSFNSVTAGSGANQVVLGNDGVKVGGKTYISDAGLNANDKKITNVANGDVTSASKDAINGSQLRNTADDIASIIGGNATVDNAGNVTASNIGGTGATTIDNAIKTVKTTVKSTDNTIKVTTNTANANDGTVFDISVDSQKLAESAQLPVVYTDADGNKVYKVGNKFTKDPTGQDATKEVAAANVIASMQNADGTISPTTLANIKAGTNDTDAVNVGQLKGAVDALGGGATINADGTIKAPTYNITNPANGTVTTANNVGDALKGLNDAVNSPLTFKGDSGEFNRNLGQTTTVKGGITDTTKLSDNNIGVVAKDGTLDIKLAKDIAVDSVKAGDTTVNTYGVSIASADPNKVVSLTASGLNNGNNRITNVAAGQAGTDAVNKDQLNKAQAAATTKVANGKNVTVAEQTNADGSKTYTVATADDLDVTSVKAGDTTINNAGVTVGDKVALSNTGLTAGDVKVSTDGINAGNKVITGVAAGVNDTDAVNVSQLKAVQQAAAAAKSTVSSTNKSVTVTSTTDATTGATNYDLAVNTDGTTITTDANGAIKANTTALTTNANGSVATPVAADAGKLATAGDIANAINNSGFNLQANGDSASLVKAGDTVQFLNGDNIEITRNGNDITVATVENPEFNTVKLGSGTSTVTLGSTNGALDVGGAKITNVAAGDVTANSTDAINGSQLRNTAGDIANIIGGNATVDNAGNVTASNIGGTGKDNINDAIAASKTEVAAGDNVTVTTSTGSNGQTIYTVSSSLAAGAGSVNYTDGSGNVVAVTAANQIQAVTDGNGNVSITNLANGEVSPTSTQAVNGSQLYALGDQINNRIDDLEKEAHAGIASAMAMEYAPYVPGKYTYAAGVAYSGGESAVGLTLRKTADNGRWSVTGGVSVATEGDPSVRLGISGIIK